ncbi:hypothetical protein ACM66B_002106 [Microbotryomycetes sp. NB124-2]
MASYNNTTAGAGAYDNTGYNSAGVGTGGAPGYGGAGGYPDTGKHGVDQGPTDKIANMIPGHNTGAPGSMPGSNNPSHRDQQYGNTSTTGTGAYNDNSAYGGNTTTGTTGLAGHHNSGTTPLSSGNTYGSQPTHEGPADKVANMIPGHHTGAPGSMPGSNNPSTTHSHDHHHSHGHHASSGVGATTGTGYGSSTTGQTTADGYGTTGGTYGAVHDHTGTGTGTTLGGHNSAAHGAGVTGPTTGAAVGQDHKPSMGEKLGGKMESMIGKITKDPTKVQEGELKAAGQLPKHDATSTTTGHHH